MIAVESSTVNTADPTGKLTNEKQSSEINAPDPKVRHPFTNTWEETYKCFSYDVETDNANFSICCSAHVMDAPLPKRAEEKQIFFFKLDSQTGKKY